MDSTVRSASEGGVGAKYEVPDLLWAFICLATSRDRYLGFMPSPLLTSTHLTDIGPRPVFALASDLGRFTQTPLLQKYSSSLAGLAHENILEYLLGEIIAIHAAVSVRGSLHGRLHDLVIVEGVDTHFAWLDHAVSDQMVCHPSDDRTA